MSQVEPSTGFSRRKRMLGLLLHLFIEILEARSLPEKKKGISASHPPSCTFSESGGGATSNGKEDSYLRSSAEAAALHQATCKCQEKWGCAFHPRRTHTVKEKGAQECMIANIWYLFLTKTYQMLWDHGRKYLWKPEGLHGENICTECCG